MKTLILTIAMVSLMTISKAEGIKTFEPEKISTQERNLVIENWMLNTNYFVQEEAPISMEEAKNINLAIDAEEEISIESWMFESNEVSESELTLENWMFESENLQEKALNLEEWMF